MFEYSVYDSYECDSVISQLRDCKSENEKIIFVNSMLDLIDKVVSNNFLILSRYSRILEKTNFLEVYWLIFKDSFESVGLDDYLEEAWDLFTSRRLVWHIPDRKISESNKSSFEDDDFQSLLDGLPDDRNLTGYDPMDLYSPDEDFFAYTAEPKNRNPHSERFLELLYEVISAHEQGNLGDSSTIKVLSEACTIALHSRLLAKFKETYQGKRVKINEQAAISSAITSITKSLTSWAKSNNKKDSVSIASYLNQNSVIQRLKSSIKVWRNIDHDGSLASKELTNLLVSYSNTCEEFSVDSYDAIQLRETMVGGFWYDSERVRQEVVGYCARTSGSIQEFLFKLSQQGMYDVNSAYVELYKYSKTNHVSFLQ